MAGEVRVQDEQGNTHVFPDGSTPEMIAKAMGVKPPAPAAPPIGPATVPPAAPLPSQEGFLSSLAAPFVDTAKGLWHIITDQPRGTVEQATSLMPGGLQMKRAIVDPAIDQGKQAASEFSQANAATPWYSMHPSPAAVSHRELALGHSLAAAIPMLGPWAASVGEKEGEQLGTGNYRGAAGTAIGNIALALAPKAVGKMAGAAPEAAQGIVRRLAGSGPGVARNLVREVAEDNRKIGLHNADRVADAQQTWQEKQAKANTDHQAELLRLRQKYAQDTRAAAEKARTGTDADRASYQSKQLAAKQKYDQAVRDQTEKFQTERVAAQKANAEAQRAYNQKIGETAQHNRGATAAERTKSDQAVHLQVGGSQLIYGLRQLDKTLRAKANDLYGAVREKMAGASLPSDTLADGVKAAQTEWIRGSPAKVAEFNAMMSPGQPGPELVLADQTAQNMGYKDFRTAISNPAIRSTLSRALPPDVWDAAIGQGTRPISWNDLQGFYEETGAKIADGPQPGKGDIYKAIQQVHQFVGDQMQQLADAQGVGPQHRAARAFYRDYMNTFHEPTGPSSSGSPVAQALLAKDPLVAANKFTGPSADRGVADLGKYSPSLANLAQDLQRTAGAKVEVPARKSATAIPAPKAVPVPAGANLPLPGVVDSAPAPRAANLPLPPIMPDAEVVPYREPKLSPTRTISADDLQRANEASVQHRGSTAVGSLIRLSVVWPAFHLLSDLMRGREVSPGGLAAIPAAGATGMAIEEVLAHPGVKEFLIKPSRAQIAQIPLDLRGEMPNIVQAARSRGVPVSPLLAAYAATIQRNQGQQFNQPQPLQQPASQGAQQ
jgi:hypothetical protein